MGQSRDDSRLLNLLGAVAIGLSDAGFDVAAHATLDTSAAAALVTLLDLAPTASVLTLSRLLGLTHSGAVRLVSRLVEGGLVDRRPGADARTAAIRLTRRGRAVAKRIRAGRSAAIAATLSGLSERERDQLETLCEIMVSNLTAARLDRRVAGERPSGGALCRMCDPVGCGRLAGKCPAAREAAHRTA